MAYFYQLTIEMYMYMYDLILKRTNQNFNVATFIIFVIFSSGIICALQGECLILLVSDLYLSYGWLF